MAFKVDENVQSNKSFNRYKKCMIFNYSLIAFVLSILLFLHGTFPLTHNDNRVAIDNDIPKFIGNTRIDDSKVYKPIVKKLILMIIDALRWDFVAEAENMPRTGKLLKNNAGCLYKTKTHFPSSTVPRTEAIATGTIPNFMDIILNLNAREKKGDSIIRQLANRGHKIVFYGDYTWTQLFPRTFYREGPVDTDLLIRSFDDDITRNVTIELQNNDWSIMIVHYSDIDHAGHGWGVGGPYMNRTLQKMDKVIEMIQSNVAIWNDNNQSSLFLVTADHGMTDEGGHGGNTPEETIVPLLAFGRACGCSKNLEVAQIDISPTLAVLFGLPIPFLNSGSVILSLIDDMDMSRKLFVLHYNAKQLFYQFNKTSVYQDPKTYENYHEAVELHAMWLDSGDYSSDMALKIMSLYNQVIREMKIYLINNLFRYNFDEMIISIIFLLQILFIHVFMEEAATKSQVKFLLALIGTFCIWICLYRLLRTETDYAFLLSKLNFFHHPEIIPVLLITIINSYLFAIHSMATTKIRSFLAKLKNVTSLEVFLFLATLVHGLSLQGTSYVTNEHRTWYYYFITLLSFFACKHIRASAEKTSLKLPKAVFFLMIAQRILIAWNRASEYIEFTRLINYLQTQIFALTVILLAGLALLVSLDFYCEQRLTRCLTLFFDTAMAVLVYLRHAASDAVLRPNFSLNFREINEVCIFWIFVLAYGTFSICRLVKARQIGENKRLRILLFFVTKKWVIISCLLHRPHNVILLPLQLIAGYMVHKYTKDEKNAHLKVYCYILISHAFYFYQGNSNSFATIDLRAGFVGLESYQPFVAGFFVTANTYSAQVLGFFMYLCDHALQNPHLNQKTVFLLHKEYLIWRLIPTILYMVIITEMRYYISIWTVFSPRMLYEAAHCILLFVVILFLQCSFFVFL